MRGSRSDSERSRTLPSTTGTFAKRSGPVPMVWSIIWLALPASPWSRRGSCGGAAAAADANAAAKATVTAEAETNDPLRLVPPATDLIVKIDHPRAISDLAIKLASRPELEGFRGYRDYFESTNYLLLRQLVGHFERELGSRWGELLDELGRGEASCWP